MHEAYLRLVGRDPTPGHLPVAAHFFAAAAEAMHRILVHRARRRARLGHHGGGRTRVDIDTFHPAVPLPDEAVVALDDALAPSCVPRNKTKAELVRLRFFGGLSLEEAGTVLGISRATASRHWAYARARLYNAIPREDSAS